MPRTPTTARGFVRVPGTATWVRWPTRRDGLLRIRMALPIQCDAPLSGRFARVRPDASVIAAWISDRPEPSRAVTVQTLRTVVVPLELGVTRQALTRGLDHAPDPAAWMIAWHADIARTLVEAAVERRRPIADGRYPAGSLRRRRIVLQAVWAGVPYALRLPRSALGVLVHVFHDPTGWRSLHLELLVAVPVSLADGVRHRRPSGRAAAAVFIQPVVRAAYRAARDLCARARMTPALRQRVDAVLGRSARDWSRTGDRQLLPQELVERSLDGVWDRLKRPSARDHRAAHRDLLRGPAVRLPPELHAYGQRCWDARLLGEPGAAARDFDLL